MWRFNVSLSVFSRCWQKVNTLLLCSPRLLLIPQIDFSIVCITLPLTCKIVTVYFLFTIKFGISAFLDMDCVWCSSSITWKMHFWMNTQKNFCTYVSKKQQQRHCLLTRLWDIEHYLTRLTNALPNTCITFGRIEYFLRHLKGHG